MIAFTIMKKDFKDALAVSKRVIPKKTGVTKLVGNGSELHVYSEGSHVKIFDYKPLIGNTHPFAIEIDPTIVDKWLDKANREMEFHVITETKLVRKVEESKTVLYCVEKKKDVEVTSFENPEKHFRNARVLEYKQFKNPDKMLETFTEVSKSFQKTERLFSDYAKFTDINMFVFDPLFFLVFLYQEELGILNGHGNDGIAIHKDALDVLIKSVKKPKDFSHILVSKNQAFLVREGNTVFWMDYKTDVPFPDYLSIKPTQEEKSVFMINADEVNESLKGFPTAKINKISFETKSLDFNNELFITPDNPEFDTYKETSSYDIPRSVFSVASLKSFFEGLVGNIEIIRVNFNSKTTKNGYFWMYRDGDKSKMMPGIKEAPGFQYSDEELAKLREQLLEGFTETTVEVLDEAEEV